MAPLCVIIGSGQFADSLGMPIGPCESVVTPWPHVSPWPSSGPTWTHWAHVHILHGRVRSHTSVGINKVHTSQFVWWLNSVNGHSQTWIRIPLYTCNLREFVKLLLS